MRVGRSYCLFIELSETILCCFSKEQDILNYRYYVERFFTSKTDDLEHLNTISLADFAP